MLAAAAWGQSRPATLAEAPIKIFPNPLRPGRGVSRFTFMGLPPRSTVKIYTLLGELTAELTADPGGFAFWDARNQNGAGVAGGVYLAYVRSGKDGRLMKIAVER